MRKEGCHIPALQFMQRVRGIGQTFGVKSTPKLGKITGRNDERIVRIWEAGMFAPALVGHREEILLIRKTN